MKSALIIRDAAVGDVINTECVIRALATIYDKVYYQSKYPEVFQKHPNLCYDAIPKDAVIYNLNNTYEKDLSINIHEAYLAACNLSSSTVDRLPRLYLSEEEIAYGHKMLPGHRWVVLAIGYPGGPLKRPYWPGVQWTDCVRGIQALGFKVVQVGHYRGGDDACPVDLDLRNRTNLRQLMGIMNAADYYFGMESGGMMVSEALRKPGLAIFKPVHPYSSLCSSGSLIHPVVRESISSLDCGDLMNHFKAMIHLP